jgi:hypothetical protein
MAQTHTIPKFCVLNGEKCDNIILPTDFITYDNCSRRFEFSSKYKVAANAKGEILKFRDNKDTTSETCYMLSRIQKKENVFRYYITKESYNQVCEGCGSNSCHSQFCRGGYCHEYYYSAQYIGKDVVKAMEVFLKLLQ